MSTINGGGERIGVKGKKSVVTLCLHSKNKLFVSNGQSSCFPIPEPEYDISALMKILANFSNHTNKKRN